MKTYRVMVVDDIEANLRVVAAMLRAEQYQVTAFTSAAAAIEAALAQPPDIILLDIDMPEMNGIEACGRIKNIPQLAGIPVLFVSALAETADKVAAFAAGGVDYVTKPFQIEEVKARVRTHLTLSALRGELQRYNDQLEQLVDEKVKEVYESQIATIVALAKLAENRDNETGKHLERVQRYADLLARELQASGPFAEQVDERYLRDLFHATPLHDIGKVAIPDQILLKPGKLTPHEFEIIKTHATVGADTLQHVLDTYPGNAFLSMGITITRSHHERWDGKGYPEGLQGDQIPLAARIMAVADVYDALRSKRVYKPAMSHTAAVAIVKDGSGSHFDPIIVAAFLFAEMRFAEISQRLEDDGISVAAHNFIQSNTAQ